jgi:tetratricopeptide (TPR) repeat protein
MKRRWFVAVCLVLLFQMGLAQKKPAVGTPDQTRLILVEKARALEARGRPDMAIQLWQQILLSDPKNTDALAGLAKDYKLIGNKAQSDEALDRLRAISPNDPSIGRIASMTSTRVQSDRLREAGELARQGKSEAAMNIYRELYGDHPPDGDIALAYYQTLYGTPLGKETAVAAMRALAQRNPGDTRFAVELGRMLTYDAKTRAEGIRILRGFPKDSIAQTALRQALVWDASNPSSAEELRQYLKDHPQDTELTGRLKEDESKLAQMNSGIARTPAERSAFAALNAHKLDEAQTRFTEILQQDPNNGRVAAGMGFLRMQQSNFGGAISYLTQAEQNGYKVKAVEDALVTSRFWYTMGEATQAFDDNQMDVAAAKFKAALAIRPRSPEALNGLAGLNIKAQQYAAASEIYEQLIKLQPRSEDAWRGLFLSYARDGQNQKALAVSARFPAPVKASLAKDPEYLRTLATIYHAQNRPVEAQRALSQALALPFPDNGTNLKTDTRLQYAGILMEAKRFDQAAELYTQILSDDAGNLPAWMGLVSAHHELGQDNAAISEVQKMPPATYESALADPGFLSMLGSIYAQANQFEIAQGLLERSAKIQMASGGQPGIPLQLQMAAIYLQQNKTAQAYEIYRQVLQAHPERIDAWKGLIATLQATNRNSEALAQIALIPPQVRKQLETDIEFVQSEASLYASAGDTAHAIEYMNRVTSHYATLKTQAPAAIEIQNAWLLFNTGNDRALYPELMRLGGRQDLTAVQRETVQTIWANWSVRRAAAAMENKDLARAVDILDAASQAFPDNMTVRKAVAGGYVQVGRARESLALFKTVPMQDATIGDYQGAIGAALAANDKVQAEAWLRQALDRFPRSPSILALAARFEQARGDNQRAAEYWRASLAAMPQASPADRLAHTLVYPDQDMKAHRAVTAADLQHLLDPNYEPFAKTTKVPPLPAYGGDPYNPGAPVNLSQSRPVQQQYATQPSDQVLQQGAPMQQNLGTQQDQPSQSQGFWFNSPPAAQSPGSVAPAPSPSYSGQPDSGSYSAQPTASQPFSVQPSTTQLADTQLPPVKGSKKSKKSKNQPSYEGSMNLPATTRPLSAQSGLEQAIAPGQAPDQDAQNAQAAQNAAPVIHSAAGDAWKGLIFSLQANNRTAEALQEVAQIPPDLRQQLEGDVEFMQAMSSLYVASGEIPHATEYLNRVQNYYLMHRVAAPAGIEVQNAWLLLNTGNDHDLYPALRGLDRRSDLTAAQRQEVQTIWANWSLRRASAEMDAGNTQRAVEILEAAARDYPDNLNVRRALAGGYVKAGMGAESLAMFKSISMQDANAGDFQAAIGSAMIAKDMAQAEKWLRQALDRFPSDPGILATAARFEQARGNDERATDFWRAALAAMPPGASAQDLNKAGVYPQQATGVRHAFQPGDLKQLLDPSNSTAPSSPRQSQLPTYRSSPYGAVSPGTQSQPLPAPQQSQPQTPWTPGPSTNLLPLPGLPASRPASGTQASTTNNAPVYVPHTGNPGAQAQAVFIEQSATQAADIKPATSKSKTGKQAGSGSKNASSSAGNNYTGLVQLPPSEENIQSTDTAPSGVQGQNPGQTSLPGAHTWQVQTGIVAHDSSPGAGLRITSQPMDTVAARAQVLFAEQTDSQLTQGSATAIRALPTAPVSSSVAQSALPPGATQYRTAQYTPSAQDAATGAYSAPRQQTAPQLAPTPQPQQPQQPAPQLTPKTKTSKKAKKAAAQQSAPTLVSAPTTPYPDQTQVTDAPAATQSTTGTGLSDQELEQRNLPPLRGPWVRVQREQRTTSPRDEAEMQLRSIESGYSGWIGGSGLINYRSGDLGFDHLSALEAPFEASFPLGFKTRFTVVAKPVFLDSGQADGNSVIQVTTLGQTKLTQIPNPLGTLLTTDTTPPPQQNAAGLGGELQLSFPHLAIAGGYTPSGFLVATFTARASWKPGNGPFTFSAVRDSVKDTQLSYGGLRDPGSASLSFPGNIWGGVVANQFNGQFSKGDAESGFYVGGGGQYLTGYNVQTNMRFDGSGGAYWRLLTSPEHGNLSIGVNFFAMHYAHNEQAFTYGMGGYFSPSAYFLANVPFTWAAHSGTRWHYNVLGSLGVQAFQEELAALFPLPGQKSIEVSSGNLALPAMTSVGPNYDLRANAAYQIGPHWFAGGFASANNSRNYSSVSAGFFVRYLFRSQPSTVTTPTGLFPTDGLRPFTVP